MRYDGGSLDRDFPSPDSPPEVEIHRGARTGSCPVCSEPAFAYTSPALRGYADACPTHAREIVHDAIEAGE